MNRLNKIVLSFVLPILCLLISVSYAYEFGTIQNNSFISLTQGTSNDGFVKDKTYGGYTLTAISTIIDNYYNNPTSYETSYNELVTSLISSGYDFILLNNGSYGYNYVLMKKGYFDTGIRIPSTAYSMMYFSPLVNDFDNFQDLIVGKAHKFSNTYYVYYIGPNSSQTINDAYDFTIDNTSDIVKYSTVSVKQLEPKGVWNGTYYYEAESEEPDTPSLPTNSEIAQAVQAFYNSDYYKNNKDFSDFIVLYDKSTQLYSFIGHTVPEWIMQVIIPPDYRYKSYMFDVQWWMFELNENSGASAYGSKYYLYSTDITAENITYNGVDTVSNLVNNPWSVSNTIIVYSTHDYTVRTYVQDEGTGDYVYTDGIIEGDQYTYDENLDITDNQYNPLDKFVTVDPSQTIVDGADFDGLSSSFEEHKDIFSFTENMQWLISANNKLSNYFLGFIVMCALFITLSRVMKG